MQMLIVTSDENGRITGAAVHNVQNPDTWTTDGGLILEDGLRHSYPPATLLFETDAALTPDVLAWATSGKYIVQSQELHEVEEWAPPTQPIPPNEPPPPSAP